MSVMYNLLAMSISALCLDHLLGWMLIQFVHAQNHRVTSIDQKGHVACDEFHLSVSRVLQ
jgi:hypothetical protein